MATLFDEEFGSITLRRSPRASSVRIRVAPDGRLRASLPLYAPAFLVKRLLKTSRSQLRAMLTEQQTSTFEHGMQIGKSHTLIVRETAVETPSVKRHDLQIIVSLPSTMDLNHPQVHRATRDVVIEALRIEAKSHLPKRLGYLADKHDMPFQKIRFSHASGRWGSCSSNGTISLNIALMKLPFELIDYVLIHELCHTQQMNHSHAFWELVGNADPLYKTHRRALKNETPSI
jgi:predicted metal-dependent hydrolase